MDIRWTSKLKNISRFGTKKKSQEHWKASLISQIKKKCVINYKVFLTVFLMLMYSETIHILAYDHIPDTPPCEHGRKQNIPFLVIKVFPKQYTSIMSPHLWNEQSIGACTDLKVRYNNTEKSVIFTKESIAFTKKLHIGKFYRTSRSTCM